MGLADRDYMRADRRPVRRAMRAARPSWLERFRFFVWRLWRTIRGGRA